MKKLWLTLIVCFIVISCTTTKSTLLEDSNPFTNYTKDLVFKSGTSHLIGDYIKQITEISKIIKKTEDDFSFEVSGHTDSVGNKDLNLDLSQKRAEKVRELLIETGCKPNRLIAKGYGETKPLASNKSKKGRETNRRVEIVAFKKASK